MIYLLIDPYRIYDCLYIYIVRINLKLLIYIFELHIINNYEKEISLDKHYNFSDYNCNKYFYAYIYVHSI